MEKYDIVLKEVEIMAGLHCDDVVRMAKKMNQDEMWTLEIEGTGLSVASGFISSDAADKLGYNYSDLSSYIRTILDDMKLENNDHQYEFKGLKIYLSRNIEE